MISGLFGEASAASIFCAATSDAGLPSSAIVTASPKPANAAERFLLIVPSPGAARPGNAPGPGARVTGGGPYS